MRMYFAVARSHVHTTMRTASCNWKQLRVQCLAQGLKHRLGGSGIHTANPSVIGRSALPAEPRQFIPIGVSQDFLLDVPTCRIFFRNRFKQKSESRVLRVFVLNTTMQELKFDPVQLGQNLNLLVRQLAGLLHQLVQWLQRKRLF